MTIPSFETTFAVPLSCDSCVKDVSTSLLQVPGVDAVNADLSQQLISVQGNAAPSAIVAAIQATGRDAILRGSGTADAAAVCILETHSTTVKDYVRGLARMVQVAPSMTVVDLSIRGLAPGNYHATIRESGDISKGPESTGKLWEQTAGGPNGEPLRGVLGNIQIWEMIGRSIVVSKTENGPFDRNDPDTLVGVIARSAGVWDNDKTVCSCSGKTVWEERQEQTDKGML